MILLINILNYTTHMIQDERKVRKVMYTLIHLLGYDVAKSVVTDWQQPKQVHSTVR